MPSSAKQTLRAILFAQTVGNAIQGLFAIFDPTSLAKQGGGSPFLTGPREPIQCIGLAMLAVSAYTLQGVYENNRRSYAVTCFIRAIYAIGAAALFERIPGQTFLVTYESVCTVIAGAAALL